MGLGSWPQRLLLAKIRERARERRAWAIASNVSLLDRMRWTASAVEVFDHDIDDFARAMIRVMHLSVE
jgi:hypothetical protein